MERRAAERRLPRAAALLVMDRSHEPEWLEACLDSIREQTFDDFGLLVMKNGILGQEHEEILCRRVSDFRNHLVSIPEAMELHRVLNYALSMIDTSYTIMCDPTQINHPNRFGSLVAELDPASTWSEAGTASFSPMMRFNANAYRVLRRRSETRQAAATPSMTPA